MSRIAKMMTEKETGSYKSFPKYIEFSESVSDATVNLDYYTEYKIGLSLHSKVYINKSSGDEVYQESVKNTKRALIEEIYGEFRNDIVQTIHLLHELKHKEAIQALGKLYAKMFEEGL